MKILLIAPPFGKKIRKKVETYPPLGILQLSAYLREKGIESEMQDLTVSETPKREIKKIFTENDFQVVGISCIIASYKSSVMIARQIKKLKPGIKIILGGIYPTFDDKEILKNNPEIDIIVRGEGELTLWKLLEKLKNNKDFSKILGISFRKGTVVYRNPDRPLIDNLDELPMPAYDQLKTLNYFQKIGKFLIITSRGCPYQCSFCSTSNYWRHRWRAKSAEKVLAELEKLVNLGAKNILVGDDLFIPDKKRVIEICQGIIRKKLKFKWICSFRANLVDKTLLRWIKKAGCDSIFIGGESGNQKTLNKIDKRQTVEEIIRARQLCKECNVKLVISFIIGFPWEKKKEIEDTINLAKQIKADETVWFIFHSDIGSPMFKAKEAITFRKYNPDKCLESLGSGTRTKYVGSKELEGLYLQAILETS